MVVAHNHSHIVLAPPTSQELDDNLAELTRQFEEATEAKLKCQREAESTALTISLANRLVGGLVSEKVRWAKSVEKFKEDEKTLAGDVLLTAAYLSYVGCFTRNYRLQLLEEKWMPFLKSLTVNAAAYNKSFCVLCNYLYITQRRTL